VIVTEPDKPRKRTPRVPSNVVYDRIVPIALAVMAVLLIIVIAIAVIGLVSAVK
jgi:hypothetical protein